MLTKEQATIHNLKIGDKVRFKNATDKTAKEIERQHGLWGQCSYYLPIQIFEVDEIQKCDPNDCEAEGTAVVWLTDCKKPAFGEFGFYIENFEKVTY